MTRGADDTIRVLQLGGDAATRVAGQIFGYLGARVTVLDGPAASVSPHWTLRERSLVTTPDVAPDAVVAEARRLASGADVVLVGPTAPAELLAWRDEPPPGGAVVTAITSELQTEFTGGPRDSMLAEAASGLYWSQFGSRPGPHCTTEPVGAYGAALIAVTGALAGLLRRRVLGGGPFISRTSYEAGALACEAVSGAFTTPVAGAREPAPDTPRYRDRLSIALTPAIRFHRAGDGWVLVGALFPSHWSRLLDLVGRADLLAHPALVDAPLVVLDQEVGEEVARSIGAWVAARPVDEVVSACARIGIIATPALTYREFLDSEHCAAQGMTERRVDGDVERTVVTGFLNRTTAEPSTSDGPAAGAHLRDGPRPLCGLRVLDLASSVAAPTCARILGDLGADVVKVEPPGGDSVRSIGLGFSLANRNKSAVSVDLRAGDGPAVLERLVRWADVCVLNQTPRVLAALGIEPGQLLALNPGLTVVRMSGLGDTGPFGGNVAIDAAAQSLIGASMAQGGGEPVGYVGGVLDSASGWFGAAAALSALLGARGGSATELGLLSFAGLLNARGLVSPPIPGEPALDADRSGYGPFRGLYPARDGWVCLAVRDGEGQARVRSALGPETALPESIAARTVAEVLATLSDAGVGAVTEVRRLPDTVAWRPDLFVEIDEPAMGRVTQIGGLVEFSFDGAGPLPLRPVGNPDETSARDVLERIGFARGEIDRLVASGVLAPITVRTRAITV
ncbi:CoA transferase [Actinophytocola sp.]|uniref:CoA transferase n=1 Tax=Actinophytocola sp. TaxID=1872138 RepID=UPI003D6B5795